VHNPHKPQTRISAVAHFARQRKREKKALLLFLLLPKRASLRGLGGRISSDWKAARLGAQPPQRREARIWQERKNAR